MSYYVGMDLHSDNNYIGVIDKKDSRILGKKLPNDLDVILKAREPFQKKIQGIVAESTYNWYWLVDGLQEAKYEVHQANPAEMQQYSGMKYTDDKWDSYWLAHMLRLGILPEGYIYPKEIRPVRDLLRKRTMLVRHRTAHVLSLQNMVNRNTGRKLKVNDAKRLSEEKISDQFADEHHKMAVQSDKAVIDFFNEQIESIETAGVYRPKRYQTGRRKERAIKRTGINIWRGHM
jgi:transposase